MTALFEVDKEVYENNLRKEAKEEGIKEGLKEAEIRMLQRYMKKQQMDFDEAFDILGIEEEKYDAYRDKIEEEERQPKLVRPGRSR